MRGRCSQSSPEALTSSQAPQVGCCMIFGWARLQYPHLPGAKLLSPHLQGADLATAGSSWLMCCPAAVRIADLVKRGTLDLGAVRFFVLDEADR